MGLIHPILTDFLTNQNFEDRAYRFHYSFISTYNLPGQIDLLVSALKVAEQTQN